MKEKKKVQGLKKDIQELKKDVQDIINIIQPLNSLQKKDILTAIKKVESESNRDKDKNINDE